MKRRSTTRAWLHSRPTSKRCGMPTQRRAVPHRMPLQTWARMRKPQPGRLAGRSPFAPIRIYLLYAPFFYDTTHCYINRFRQASRVARPSQGGENMTAVWASRHEDLVSDGVASPHVFDHLVVPDRGVVLARCNPPGSVVDACLDAAAQARRAERAVDDGV